MKRRTFLQRTSLVTLSPFVPAFVPQAAVATDTRNNGRILVVLQLSGGNDGLNTLIPWSNENYAKHRRVLRIADDNVIRLNDSVGLHPNMKPMAELFENSQLAIVQGVGYPNPNRSHFESMDIWHTAHMNQEDRTGHGWLGRAIDGGRTAARQAQLQTDRTGAQNSPDAVFVGDSEIPVAVRGRRANSISLNSEEELRLYASVAKPVQTSDSRDLTSFIRQTVDSSYTAARRFAESAPASDDSSYPPSKLGKKLQLLSRILRMGGSTRVFYTSQGGYDTHSDQLGRHSSLLREFSQAVAAFLKDMEEAGLGDRVVVLAFSEFGRRVAENGSDGTDHGTAGPVFVAGSPVNAGFHGTYPSLTDLDDGDLKMTIDFRSVYASLLQHWLKVDSVPILNGSFQPLPLIG